MRALYLQAPVYEALSDKEETDQAGDGNEDAMGTMIVRMRKRGMITIPVELREKYNIQEGDVFSILDLGGVFILSPGASEVERNAREIEELLLEEGVSVQELLDALRVERDRYYQERYGQGEDE